jgi:phosphoglycerate dehydrogenase-like enzyme
MKVLFHYDAGPALLEQVAKLGERGLRVVCCPEGPEEPFHTELAESEVLWHVLQPISAEHIERAPGLKLIQKIGVGVNTIDLQAARERGIAVCNMPGTNSRAVAEMTLLLMLSALRKQPALDRACRSGQWFVDQASKEAFGEIGGRRVGLVGFGAVPQILAPILELMGAEVVYTATARKAVPYTYLGLEELLQGSDIVSLHLPLTPDTEVLLNASRLALMKPGAILVNTARGGLVDESALLDALAGGHLGGAGLDVFSREPVPADNPLLALDNVSVAPHLAWLTPETFTRSIDIAVHNSLAIGAGTGLLHRVV